MQEVQIRKRTMTDDAEIFALIEEAGWKTILQSEEAFQQALFHSIVLVAEQEKRVVGYARSITDGSMTAFLCELLVQKEKRKKGIGRKLIEALEAMLPTIRMDLISEQDGFYETLGYRSLGQGYRKYLI